MIVQHEGSSCSFCVQKTGIDFLSIPESVYPIIVGVTGFFRRLNGADLTRLLTRADVDRKFLSGRSGEIADVARLVACQNVLKSFMWRAKIDYYKLSYRYKI